jgi:hypothetical protein
MLLKPPDLGVHTPRALLRLRISYKLLIGGVLGVGGIAVLMGLAIGYCVFPTRVATDTRELLPKRPGATIDFARERPDTYGIPIVAERRRLFETV